MRIYLFRHGEALAKGDPAVSSDADRPLIEEGVRRTRQAAEGFKNLGITLDAAFTSPWLRARQTAQIAAEVLGISDKLTDMDELAGDRTVEEVMNALARKPGLENVMLFGHNPLLSDLAAYLLSLSTRMQVDLKKSGVCAVEVERVPPKSHGTLLWMLTGRQMRAMR